MNNPRDRAPLNGNPTLDDIQDLFELKIGPSNKAIISFDNKRWSQLTKSYDFDQELVMKLVKENVFDDHQPEAQFIDWVTVFQDYKALKYGDRDDLTSYVS